jgi:phospholipid-binding lipoprotein MlaA
MYLVTLRSRGLDAEGLLDGVYDPYVFYRDAYRQRRLYDIYDGQPPAEVIEQMQGTGDVDVDQLLDEQRAYEKKNGDK